MPLPTYVQEAVKVPEVSETSLPDYVTKAVTEKNQSEQKFDSNIPQELDSTAPDWMKDSPFLAGLYGAGKGILEQAVAPAIEGVGMVAGSLGSPLIGTALGYGAARQLNDYLIDSYRRLGGEDPKVPTVSEEMLQSAADVGSVLVIGGLMNTGAKLAPIMEDYLFHSLPKRLYGSAIKTPMSKKWIQTLPNEVASKQTAAVEEGLSSRISPSEYGLSKIKNLEKEALEYIDDITKILSKDPSKAISREAVLEKGLEKAYSKASKSSDPIGAKAYVDAIANRFKAHPKNLTPANANQIKRQLYEEVKYGGSEPSGLSAQLNSVGKKGVAREIMLNLEEVYPPLADLNATDAARISLVEAIERTFAKEAQKNLIPLGAKILMRPRTWPLAIWEGTVGHPQVKTRLAFALHKANPAKYPAKPSSYTPPPAPKPSKPQKPYRYTPPEQGPVQPHKPMDLPKVESPNIKSVKTFPSNAEYEGPEGVLYHASDKVFSEGKPNTSSAYFGNQNLVDSQSIDGYGKNIYAIQPPKNAKILDINEIYRGGPTSKDAWTFMKKVVETAKGKPHSEFNYGGTTQPPKEIIKMIKAKDTKAWDEFQDYFMDIEDTDHILKIADDLGYDIVRFMDEHIMSKATIDKSIALNPKTWKPFKGTYTPDQLHKMLRSKDVSRTEMAVQDIIDTRKKVEISERERIQTINDMLNKFKGDK